MRSVRGRRHRSETSENRGSLGSTDKPRVAPWAPEVIPGETGLSGVAADAPSAAHVPRAAAGSTAPSWSWWSFAISAICRSPRRLRVGQGRLGAAPACQERRPIPRCCRPPGCREGRLRAGQPPAAVPDGPAMGWAGAMRVRSNAWADPGRAWQSGCLGMFTIPVRARQNALNPGAKHSHGWAMASTHLHRRAGVFWRARRAWRKILSPPPVIPAPATP